MSHGPDWPLSAKRVNRGPFVLIQMEVLHAGPHEEPWQEARGLREATGGSRARRARRSGRAPHGPKERAQAAAKSSSRRPAEPTLERCRGRSRAPTRRCPGQWRSPRTQPGGWRRPRPRPRLSKGAVEEEFESSSTLKSSRELEDKLHDKSASVDSMRPLATREEEVPSEEKRRRVSRMRAGGLPFARPAHTKRLMLIDAISTVSRESRS